MEKYSVPENIYREWAKYKPIANSGVMLLNQENQVLLLERGFGCNKGLWELSGGSIEISETPKEAALRELEEETGVKAVNNITELGTFRAVNPDKVDICTIFVAYIDIPVSIRLGNEHSAYKWVDLCKAKEYPMCPANREIIDFVCRTRPELLVNNKPKVTILVPSLNEIKGIPITLPKINKGWYDQIIVLDGFSTDGTIEWCKEHGYTVFQRSKPGLWDAYTEVFDSGIITGDIVITFSPDGNSIPEVIPELIDKINEGYDMVIASRYLGGKISPDDTWLTKIGNKILTGISNFNSSYKYSDALVMYRAYRKDIIHKLKLTTKPNWLQRKLISKSGLYSYEPSLAIRCIKNNLKVSEIFAEEPPAYRERRQNTFNHGFVLLTQILMEKLWNPK